MKIALYVGASVILIIVIILAVAASLPVQHTVSRSMRLKKTPSEVFALISGPPNWRPGVKESTELPPDGGLRRWRELSGDGKSMTYETTEESPPSRLVTRIADRNLPFGGTWTYEIEPADGSCVLRITERGEIYNIIFRFVARFFLGYSVTIENYLRAVADQFHQQAVIEPG
jgi:Polyketide cyclase / dehydrase and lipid transport